MLGLAARAGNSILSGTGPQEVTRKRGKRPRQQPVKVKEWMKNLVLIDFQGQEPNQECPLFDYQKIFDGLMQITSDQSESDIREEVGSAEGFMHSPAGVVNS